MNNQINILKEKGIWIGTSSWKYAGWKNLIYHHDYKNDKDFSENCLKEYSHTFSSVGVDHTYYNWPSQRVLEKYNEQTPEGFRFVLKATDKITVFKYPKIPRYGALAGKLNPSFLDFELFKKEFMTPALTLNKKLGAIFLEFSHFHPGTIGSGREFVEQLKGFLEHYKSEFDVPLGIEIRNRNWIVPAYFEVLVRNQVGHVFNSWTQMPSLDGQLEAAEPFDLPFYLVRLLLKPGVLYQEAVDKFQPYDHIQEEVSEVRLSAARLVSRALAQNKKTYILVNNRLEGCAPKTIEAILAALKT